ncbi:MAG: 4Fe-4S binding protein [Pyrinomonadaceae bacterium]|nr:4Fe-4S binding protein [Pyrinomonadaceae bacterium]
MKKGCEGKDISTKKRKDLPVLGNAPPNEGGIRDSRTAKWRAGVLITLNLLMIIHIVQWAMTGSTVSPIEPSESMYTLQDGAVNAGFIFFTAAIIATLIFGRFVCGWACHIVALQDLCGWFLKKIGLTPKPFRSRLLIFVPLIVALYMFVYPTVARFFLKPAAEPIFPQFTNHIITTDFWATFPPAYVAIPFLFICGFMTVYFLGQKGFCTYACPYGGFFAVADKVAPGKIRVTDACNQCGHCTAVCTSNVLVHAEVKEYGMVVDQGCMKCMDCVSVCPNDALYFGFGKPAVGTKQTIKKNYSLTLAEDIGAAVVFAAAFFAVWDAYQLVPMLMALGVASVSTFLAVKTWKTLRSKDAAFYKYKLRSAGRIQNAGWAFLAFSVAWIGLNFHSGFVRYYEAGGNAAYERVLIPDELALAEADPKRWITPEMQTEIDRGIDRYERAFDFALFTNVHALPKYAWLEYLSGDSTRAVELLERAAKNQSGQQRALSLYYRGAILNRIDRPKEALTDLETAAAEAPDLVLAHEEKGEAFWRLGRKLEAVGAWRDALKLNPAMPLANNFLSGAAENMDQQETARLYKTVADKYTPNDPYFHWVLAKRLENLGMKQLADAHFEKSSNLAPTK